MRRTDYHPYIGTQAWHVSVGKRAHKGLIVLRNVPPMSDLSRNLTQKMLSRMEEYDRNQVRIMTLHRGQAWWLTELQALPARNEEDGWNWLRQD